MIPVLQKGQEIRITLSCVLFQMLFYHSICRQDDLCFL